MSRSARQSVAVSILVVIAGSAAASAQEMSEAEALRRFERENAQARSLVARVREVRAETRLASLAPNPSVTYTREDSAGTQDTFLLVQQQLPVAGRLGLLRRASDAATEAAQANTDYQLLLLRSEFRASFHALLLAQNRETQLARVGAELERILQILRQREREGEGSAFDRLRVEREVADAQANLASARVVLAQARARLAAMLAPGTDPQALRVRAEANPPPDLPPLEELLKRSNGKRGDLAARRNELARIGFEERAATRSRIPEPILSAGLKRTTLPGNRDNGYSISLTLPLPLFNRGQSEVERARAARDRTQGEVAALQQLVESEIRAAYESLRLRRQVSEQYAKDLGQRSEELARIAEVAYQEGEQGILELLDAIRVSLYSRLQAMELAALSKQAEIELNRAVGEEVIP